MLKKIMLVTTMVVLLAAVESMAAQDNNEPAAPQSSDIERGERSLQAGQGRPESMRGGFNTFLDELTKAYEQKDMEKIGQLIEDTKQRRQRFQRGAGGPEGRFGRGMGPGQGPPMPGEAGGSSSQNLPIAKSEMEKKILSVLDDMDKNQRRGMMNVPIEDGRLLRLLAESVNAKHVVEIGTSNGYSGIWLCLALQTTGGKLTTYEIDAQRAALARENFKRAGVDKIVTLVEGDAHEEVTKLKEPIDILFIDADKEGYIDYLNKLLPLVRPGGLIVAHNVDMRGQLQEYVTAVTTKAELETVFYQQGGGISVTLKKRLSK
jgi:predicted O-methyltransferase YrrM